MTGGLGVFVQLQLALFSLARVEHRHGR
jgi:hypothetical protein